MRRLPASILLAFAPIACLSGPQFDNPMRVGCALVDPADPDGIQVPSNGPSGEAYAALFERLLDAVDDFFPIAYANRADGRIIGRPTIAPGYEQFWKPGSQDSYQRTLASLQAYRYRCEVRIREADQTSYFVQVIVRKELKDYPSPAGLYTSIPVFGDAGTVDRDQFLVVDPDITSPIEKPGDRWIPKGRETSIEQAILKKLQQCP